MRGKFVHELKLLVRVRVWGWVRVMIWLSSGHLLLSGDGLGFWVMVDGSGVRGKKVIVKSRDCALASDLVRAHLIILTQSSLPEHLDLIILT